MTLLQRLLVEARLEREFNWSKEEKEGFWAPTSQRPRNAEVQLMTMCRDVDKPKKESKT